MSDTVMTKKGTVLPLLNLKGKKYLMGAYRLQWLNEEVERFTISTEFLQMTDTHAIARSTINIYNSEGILLKSATATKREDAKHFPDFLEKAESAASFRALACLGYGTQYALSDLDEGTRLADSPLVDTTKVEVKQQPVSANEGNAANVQPEKQLMKKPASFRKPTKGLKEELLSSKEEVVSKVKEDVAVNVPTEGWD